MIVAQAVRAFNSAWDRAVWPGLAALPPLSHSFAACQPLQCPHCRAHNLNFSSWFLTGRDAYMHA